MTIIDDVLNELEETLWLQASVSDANVIVNPNTAFIIIMDNDCENYQWEKL